MASFKKHSQLIYAKKKKCAKMVNVLWGGRAGIDKKKLLLLLRFEVFSNNPFYGNQIILLSSCSYIYVTYCNYYIGL